MANSIKPIAITVLAEDLVSGDLRRRIGTLYTCTGPDGRQFDNRNLTTLRDVLRRCYGAVALEINDQTAGQRAGDGRSGHGRGSVRVGRFLVSRSGRRSDGGLT